jgi:phenylpyruvate tautomerase PptA (4-oxalocrotonate tautomerase family)
MSPYFGDVPERTTEAITVSDTFNWRDHLDVHPAAELFPPMSADDLKVFAEDIKKHDGMYMPVVLYGEALLDGRNRLDALALLGLLNIDGGRLAYRGADGIRRYVPVHHASEPLDPYEFALSLNLHRRHLTAEQKRELIAKVLKATPEKSNRQIAEIVKTDKNNVAAVRKEKESTGEISPVEKTTGKDGKARKQRKKPTPEQVRERAKRQAEKKTAELNAALDKVRTNGATEPKPIEPTAEASADARKALYAVAMSQQQAQEFIKKTSDMMAGMIGGSATVTVRVEYTPHGKEAVVIETASGATVPKDRAA